MAKPTQFYTLQFLVVAALIFQLSSAFGINYRTLGNLPPPQQVVDFIKTKTTFETVKIFDANPDILRALAGTGIDVTIMVPNGNIPTMADVGILRGGRGGRGGRGDRGGTTPIIPQGKWCKAKEDATNEQLQANINWVCSQGIDCNPIAPGGRCFDNNNLRSRSTFVMNAYYQSKSCADDACNFSGSGIVSNTNPSTGTCIISNVNPSA